MIKRLVALTMLVDAATLLSLGLRKIRQQVVRPDNPAVRGMIHKVRHLITVEEAE